MKLKKVDRDSWLKCCRYCHHYTNGKCMNTYTPLIVEEDNLAVYKVSEEGYLDGCIEETLGSIKLEEFRELEYLLRSFKLSEKRIKEFNDLFIKCWEEFSHDTLRPVLEENVTRCYVNHLEDGTSSAGFIIKDPENYCCKDWC